MEFQIAQVHNTPEDTVFGPKEHAFGTVWSFRSQNIENVKNLLKNYLFPPYSEKTAEQFQIRDEVPLFDHAPYNLYKEACVRLVSDWLDGKVGSGAPKEKWEKKLIAEVNNLMRGKMEGTEAEQFSKDQEATIAQLYDQLVQRNAPTHLRTATSHRNWLRRSLKFCQMIGATFSGDMEDLIRKHDLSKYTPEEVLGYAVMFGDGQVSWKKLEIVEEKNEWNLALDHHYIHNPHHPEYFYPKQGNGQREKFSIVEADPKGRLYIEESLIDMLASRGERNLKDDPAVSVGKWLDIAEVYLTRYSETDKKYVMQLLSKWIEMGKDFVSDHENAESLKDLFGREVGL